MLFLIVLASFTNKNMISRPVHATKQFQKIVFFFIGGACAEKNRKVRCLVPVQKINFDKKFGSGPAGPDRGVVVARTEGAAAEGPPRGRPPRGPRSRDPRSRDPESRDPRSRVPESRDPRSRDPRSRDP